MKMYPFSAEKHAHDIELVANRAYNLAWECQEHGDDKGYIAYMELHDEANEVLQAIMDGMVSFTVTMLSGKMIGKAKEMVIRATEIRQGLIMRYKEDDDEC